MAVRQEITRLYLQPGVPFFPKLQIFKLDGGDGFLADVPQDTVDTGGLLFIFAEPLVRLFSRDGDVIRLGTTVLRMVAVSEPFYEIPIVVEGLMQGVGKTTAPFVYNVIGMGAVRITGTWICTGMLGLGLVAAWGCMIGHNLLLCAFFIYHYFSGRWDPFVSRQRNGTGSAQADGS